MMETISVSQFKINPALVIAQSQAYPVSVTAHNQIKAYVIGKALYEQLIAQLEDQNDRKAIAATDFSIGKDFGQLTQELGL